jgi:hypothetical protein
MVGNEFPSSRYTLELRRKSVDVYDGFSECLHTPERFLQGETVVVKPPRGRFIEEAYAGTCQAQTPFNILPTIERNFFVEGVSLCHMRGET